MQVNKYHISSFIVVLFHAVGLYGYLNPDLQSQFQQLVPFHLLLMFAMLIVSGFEQNKNLFLFGLLIFLAGYFIEVLGVNTGKVFGNYEYGDTLGLKVWSTPLMIGVNWLILVYCTGVFLTSLNFRNPFVFALVGACILVVLDLLIEPVAVQFDYWSWDNGLIPLQNYVGWFLFSALLFYLFTIFQFRKRNPTAIVLLIVQFAFFTALNIWAF